jgi:hypothetical protein
VQRDSGAFAKVTAEQLASSSNADKHVRFMACAANGVQTPDAQVLAAELCSTLGLSDAAQLNAFLELCGP